MGGRGSAAGQSNIHVPSWCSPVWLKTLQQRSASQRPHGTVGHTSHTLHTHHSAHAVCGCRTNRMVIWVCCCIDSAVTAEEETGLFTITVHWKQTTQIHTHTGTSPAPGNCRTRKHFAPQMWFKHDLESLNVQRLIKQWFAPSAHHLAATSRQGCIISWGQPGWNLCWWIVLSMNCVFLLQPVSTLQAHTASYTWQDYYSPPAASATVLGSGDGSLPALGLLCVR